MERQSQSAARRGRSWLLVLPFVAGCTTLDVYSVAMPGTSFTGYHTYAHGAPEVSPRGFGRTTLTPAVWKKVQEDIDVNFAKKGYVLAAVGAAPDLVVRSGSGARVEERREGEAVHGENDWGDANVVADYTEATIVIDVFDAHTHKLLWHGASGRSLDAPLTSANDASIAEAVTAILRGFPSADATHP